jgi:hypothetical protein
MPFGAHLSLPAEKRGMEAKQPNVWHGRLYSQYFWVDARLSRQNGRWIASIDTPDGPSLGWGRTALSAMIGALEPFDGMAMDLLHSAPADLTRLLG